MNAVAELSEDSLRKTAAMVQQVKKEVAKKIVGQEQVIERLLMALVLEGHVLLEGLPGLAKTTMIKTLGEATGLRFGRVQFTPDLLPADVTGTQVFDPRSATFGVRKGPVFTHLLLADEINRAPAKVQSALLEVMQERQVTIGNETFSLERPFLVLATQNPIEQDGTYPLPEAQLDRFLFKTLVTWPTHEEEMEIMKRASSQEDAKIERVMGRDDLREIGQQCRAVYVSDQLRKYVVALVAKTRQSSEKNVSPAYGKSSTLRFVEFGASPRASISLEMAARASAVFRGQKFVSPQDVKNIAHDVLRHRMVLSFEAEAEGINADMIVRELLDSVEAP